MKMIKLARSKEALLLEAKRVAKSAGLSVDDFVVLPITNELRNHPKMKALEPDVTEPVYRYVLVKKSIGGKDFVVLQADGKVRLDFGALPENALAKEMNQPIRQDVPKEGTVDVAPGKATDMATKSVSDKDVECKGKGCDEEDKKEGSEDETGNKEHLETAEKAVLDVDRTEEVPNEGIVALEGDNPEEAVVNKALPLLEKLVAGEELADAELATVKTLISAMKIAKSLLLEDFEKKSVSSADNENDELGDVTFLGAVINKSLLEANEIEKRAQEAAVVAAKKALETSSSRQAIDELRKIVAKSVAGEDIGADEAAVLKAAIDAAKQAKTEVVKSVANLAAKISDVEETPEALYKAIMKREPTNGLFIFARKAEATKFIDRIQTKSLVAATPYTRAISAAERKAHKIPTKYRFVVVFQ